MSYENAPATRMMATQCAICARPLVDAKSVEIGIGPDCRKKYGYNTEVTEEARIEANQIIYRIACAQKGAEVVDGCKRLFALGLIGVVTAVLNRVAPVKIALSPQWPYRLAVKTPYNERAVQLMRGVPGRRWDPENKLNTFPQESKEKLYAALAEAYPGMTAVGPEGPFILGEAPKTLVGEQLQLFKELAA